MAVTREDAIVAALTSLGAGSWHTNAEIRVAAQELFPNCFDDKRFPRDALRYLHAVESRRRPGKNSGVRGLTEYRLRTAAEAAAALAKAAAAVHSPQGADSSDEGANSSSSAAMRRNTSPALSVADGSSAAGADDDSGAPRGTTVSGRRRKSSESTRSANASDDDVESDEFHVSGGNGSFDDGKSRIVPPKKRRKPARNGSAQSPPARPQAELIWAKVADYPWWPCRIVRTISDIPDSSTRRALQGKQPAGDPNAKCVNFLVDDTFLWVESQNLRPWNGPHHRELLSQRGDGVEHAIATALSRDAESPRVEPSSEPSAILTHNQHSPEGRRFEKEAIEQALRSLGSDGWHTCGQIRSEAQRLFPQLLDVDSQRFPSGYLRAMKVERRKSSSAQYEYRLLVQSSSRKGRTGSGTKKTRRGKLSTARRKRASTVKTEVQATDEPDTSASSSSEAERSSESEDAVSSSDDGYSAASELLAASAAARQGLAPLRVASSSVIEGLNARAAEIVDAASPLATEADGDSQSGARVSAATALATWATIAPARTHLFRSRENSPSPSQIDALPTPQREIVQALLQLGRWSSSADVCATIEQMAPGATTMQSVQSVLADAPGNLWLRRADCGQDGNAAPRRPPARSQSWQDPPIPRGFGSPANHARTDVLLAAALANTSSDDDADAQLQSGSGESDGASSDAASDVA